MCPLSYAFIIRVKKSLQRDFSSVVNNDALKPNLHASLPKLQVNAVLFDCTWVFFSPSAHSSSELFPLMLWLYFPACCHFWVALWGMFWTACVCVCACMCEHYFFSILSAAMCVCVCALDSQPICMEMKWNDRSCLRNEHFSGRYCWLFMGCCWGFDSVIWPGGELANLGFFFFFFFFHPLPSLSHFLYPLHGFTLLLFFFSLFASYHFFWLKSLTLKFARKKKEDKRRVQQDVVVQIGVEEPCQLSALCLGSDNVALFEIASRKDNCASRCCNKLMTVLTLKLEEYLQWVKTDDFSSCSSMYICVKWNACVPECDTKRYIQQTVYGCCVRARRLLWPRAPASHPILRVLSNSI